MKRHYSDPLNPLFVFFYFDLFCHFVRKYQDQTQYKVTADTHILFILSPTVTIQMHNDRQSMWRICSLFKITSSFSFLDIIRVGRIDPAPW